MAFTQKKYLELSPFNKKKKFAFAILEYLDGKQELSYIQEMFGWYQHSIGNIDNQMPQNSSQWQILHQQLVQQIEESGQNIDSKLFDGQPSNNGQGVIILDNIRAPYNVGGIMRSAEAFNAAKVVMCGITPTTQNGKVLRSAMNVPIATDYFEKTTDAITFYRNLGYQIIAIEKTTNSTDINCVQNLVAIDKRVLILGNEEFGVSEEILNASDMICHINLTGSKNSLNVCTAAGIAMYCLLKNN